MQRLPQTYTTTIIWSQIRKKWYFFKSRRIKFLYDEKDSNSWLIWNCKEFTVFQPMECNKERYNQTMRVTKFGKFFVGCRHRKEIPTAMKVSEANSHLWKIFVHWDPKVQFQFFKILFSVHYYINWWLWINTPPTEFCEFWLPPLFPRKITVSSVLPALKLSLNCWQSDRTELLQLSTHSLAEYSLPKVTKITPSSEYLNGKLFWAKGSRMSLMSLLKRVFLGLTHGKKTLQVRQFAKLSLLST